MGLDSFLDKVTKNENAKTIKDYYTADNILDYRMDKAIFKTLDENGKNYSCKKWCGTDEKAIPETELKSYAEEYKIRFYGWDVEKKYGHYSLFDGVGYWRKANAIHRWFVENVQDGNDDCGEYEVTKEKLEELKDTCLEVLAGCELVDGKVKNGATLVDGEWQDNIEDGKVIADVSVAESLLPTTSGFFFGSTEYDEWYVKDIQHTIDIIAKVLEETDFEKEIIIYSSSW